MKWILLWFVIYHGKPIPLEGLPFKDFDSKAACEEFAKSRVGMVGWRFDIPTRAIRYECKGTWGQKP